MRFTKGQKSKKLPEGIAEVCSVILVQGIRPNRYRKRLVIVSVPHLQAIQAAYDKKGASTGIPDCVAFTCGIENKLLLAPIPDRSYEVTVGYTVYKEI